MKNTNEGRCSKGLTGTQNIHREASDSPENPVFSTTLLKRLLKIIQKAHIIPYRDWFFYYYSFFAARGHLGFSIMIQFAGGIWSYASPPAFLEVLECIS